MTHPGLSFSVRDAAILHGGIAARFNSRLTIAQNHESEALPAQSLFSNSPAIPTISIGRAVGSHLVAAPSNASSFSRKRARSKIDSPYICAKERHRPHPPPSIFHANKECNKEEISSRYTYERDSLYKIYVVTTLS